MSSISPFKSPATYHLLSYGTLLGSTLFQSFIGGVVAYRALPRAQFSTLQKSIFPPYFVLQTVAPLALWATYPRSLITAITSSPSAASAVAGTNDKRNAYLVATMLVTAVFNLVYAGPKTTEIMQVRKHQETRDGKKSWDAGPHSPEMQALNKQFAILHSVSSFVNLVGLGAMIWYGAVLGEGLSL
ncbi:hypothetical protein FB567DRAFT_500360 [Paraphoma chrysanthemicola]|uniref:TMEM205-like domain-containing protein n=1 Tax=Paraphoma chrysanthemicola TaxID=798071 RepID=A0A8K0R0A1_9PLEO|nr:hypothetical protein FB567DRAFT_500360 [Paraphoma chrysanthemicola]